MMTSVLPDVIGGGLRVLNILLAYPRFIDFRAEGGHDREVMREGENRIKTNIGVDLNRGKIFNAGGHDLRTPLAIVMTNPDTDVEVDLNHPAVNSVK